MVLLTTVSRLEGAKISLLTLEIVRFELLHRFTPFLDENIIDLS